MQSIYRRIRLTILLFLVLISAFVFLGIYLPFTDKLESDVIKCFGLVTNNKHQVFEASLMDVRYTAASLSSRPIIGEQLAQYLEGRLDFEELENATIMQYTDGVGFVDNLLSAARVIVNGQVIHCVGPDKNLEDYVQWKESELICRFISEEMLVAVQSPVIRDGKILAYDIILADAYPIVTELEEDIFELSLLQEKREEGVVVANGKITSYMNSELVDGTIAISADEKAAFGSVRTMTANVSVRFIFVMTIMFLIIQFLIVRFIRGFIDTQQELKVTAEEREKEREQAQKDLFWEREMFHSTLLSVREGIISTDVKGLITIVNPVVEELTGWKQNEVLGKNIDVVFKLIHPETRRLIKRLGSAAYTNRMQKGNDIEALLETRYGKELRISESAAAIRLPDGEIRGFVVVFRDVTEVYEKQKKIEHMSFHDDLTGLYNRRYMEDALHRLDTPRNLPFTIMMLDLNGLKLANDVFGHDLGDRLIKKTAELLRDVFREDDIIARIGGDEFCILMPKTSVEAAKAAKDRIDNASNLYRVETLRVSIAVGYAVKTKKTEKIDDILRYADLDMYQNKQEGRQQIKNRTIEDFMEYNRIRSQSEKLHRDRMVIFAPALYEALGKSQAKVSAFQKAVRVHDIGKVVIPDEILNKKERLNPDERQIIRRHAQAGYQILKVLKEHEAYAEAILYHHERVDGAGYPEGLMRDAIPLEAKIIAVADAYDSMTSDHPYRKAMTKEQAVAELRKNAGTQFDSSLVEVFIEKVLPKIPE